MVFCLFYFRCAHIMYVFRALKPVDFIVLVFKCRTIGVYLIVTLVLNISKDYVLKLRD